MNRETLERPFPNELLRTRKGRFGQTFTYVEGAEYVRRLNEAFEGEWSFEIVEHAVRDGEVVVIGKLTVGGVTKMSFGGSSITVSRDGEVISIADDLKGAATDALKKAASLLGVGLHLYSSDQPAETNRPAARGGNGKSNGNGRREGYHVRRGDNEDGNRLTQKQLSCIWSMGRSMGLSADQIRERTTEVYGVHPEHMSKSDASAFITELGQGLSGDVVQ